MLREGCISENDLGIYSVTDDPQEAAHLIIESAREQ
jgi:hypothetical protein